MEKFKDPAMLLSTANTLAIAGSTWYFYKQIEELKGNLQKIGDALTKVIGTVGTLSKNDAQQKEMLRLLGDQVQTISRSLEELPSLENLDNINSNVSEIVEALSENGIELPSTPVPTARRIANSSGKKLPTKKPIEDPRKTSTRRTPRSGGTESTPRRATALAPTRTAPAPRVEDVTGDDTQSVNEDSEVEYSEIIEKARKVATTVPASN